MPITFAFLLLYLGILFYFCGNTTDFLKALCGTVFQLLDLVDLEFLNCSLVFGITLCKGSKHQKSPLQAYSGVLRTTPDLGTAISTFQSSFTSIIPFNLILHILNKV